MDEMIENFESAPADPAEAAFDEHLRAAAENRLRLMKRRILREYEAIAFDRDNKEIKTADRMRALEMCRLLVEEEVQNICSGGNTPQPSVIVVNYDYGDK